MKPLAPLSDDEFTRLVGRAVRELPDAPPALVQAAIGLWPAAGPGAVLSSLLQAVVAQVQAVLTFDSWALPAAAAGMRSLRSPTRHLLFSAQGRDIDLRLSPVSPEAGLYTLAGQILGPDESGSVQLDAAEPGVAPLTAELDGLGEFRIGGIRRGSYVMTLLLGGERIVLPPVEVGEPAA
jgi:hypothetical protein